MENVADWHGKAPKEEEYKLAMEELNKGLSPKIKMFKGEKQ